MANKKSGNAAKRTSRHKRLKRDLLYFYLDNDKLYKIYHVNRPSNIATCWDYQNNSWIKFSWSDLQKNAQRAYTTKEVSRMVGRFWTIIERYIHAGEIPPPKKSYAIVGEHLETAAFRWSEKDIMRLHDLMLTKYRGRPRNDGMGAPQAMPSKAELQAIMRNESITYIKDESGEFQPVWKEINW